MDKKEIILTVAATLFPITHTKGTLPKQVEENFMQWVKIVEKAYKAIEN